jgi:putative membrane protein
MSLISFGFTIAQFFAKLADKIPGGPITHHAARTFGLSLIFLGVGLLVVGLYEHMAAVAHLRQRRAKLLGLGLLHTGPQVRPSSSAIVAVLLLILGLVAFVGLALRVGPFT